MWTHYIDIVLAIPAILFTVTIVIFGLLNKDEGATRWDNYAATAMLLGAALVSHFVFG